MIDEDKDNHDMESMMMIIIMMMIMTWCLIINKTV